MADRKATTTVKGARSWVGTLLVAWTFVSGSALVIATAHYQRSHDLAILIAWLTPPFAIGIVLFVIMGIVSLAGGVKDRPVDVVNHTGTRQSIFRK